jgi:hypothetical protein
MKEETFAAAQCARHSIPPHALDNGESFGAGTACSGVMGEGGWVVKLMLQLVSGVRRMMDYAAGGRETRAGE